MSRNWNQIMKAVFLHENMMLHLSEQIKDINLNAILHIYIYVNGIRKQNAVSTHNLRISLTICGVRFQLRILQQLNLTIHMSYYLFVDSKNCSGFRKYSCGFHKVAKFSSAFERYSVWGICLWNPKQQRRSKRSSKVAGSATNLILACCGFQLQCIECTVWPRNEILNDFAQLIESANYASFI